MNSSLPGCAEKKKTPAEFHPRMPFRFIDSPSGKLPARAIRLEKTSVPFWATPSKGPKRRSTVNGFSPPKLPSFREAPHCSELPVRDRASSHRPRGSTSLGPLDGTQSGAFPKWLAFCIKIGLRGVSQKMVASKYRGSHKMVGFLLVTSKYARITPPSSLLSVPQNLSQCSCFFVPFLPQLRLRAAS